MTDKPLRLINGTWMANLKGWPEKPDFCFGYSPETMCVKNLEEDCVCDHRDDIYQTNLKTAIEEAIPVDKESIKHLPLILGQHKKGTCFAVPEGHVWSTYVMPLNKSLRSENQRLKEELDKMKVKE